MAALVGPWEILQLSGREDVALWEELAIAASKGTKCFDADVSSIMGKLIDSDGTSRALDHAATLLGKVQEKRMTPKFEIIVPVVYEDQTFWSRAGEGVPWCEEFVEEVSVKKLAVQYEGVHGKTLTGVGEAVESLASLCMGLQKPCISAVLSARRVMFNLRLTYAAAARHVVLLRADPRLVEFKCHLFTQLTCAVSKMETCLASEGLEKK